MDLLEKTSMLEHGNFDKNAIINDSGGLEKYSVYETMTIMRTLAYRVAEIISGIVKLNRPAVEYINTKYIHKDLLQALNLKLKKK